MLPGSGCWVGRVTSHRDGAGLCCASPPACPALREDVGRSRCVFEAVLGVNVSLCSKSHQQFTPRPHTAQHLPWELANPLASPQKCSGVPFPRGIPQSCVLRWDPHPLQEHEGRAGGRRGSGSTGTLAGGKKPFEETTPDKSGGFIQIRCCLEERGAFVGSEGPSQPSTCPRPAPPALAPAAAAGPAARPGACQGCQHGPKCSLSPQLRGLP